MRFAEQHRVDTLDARAAYELSLGYECGVQVVYSGLQGYRTAWHHAAVDSGDSHLGFAFPRLYRQWTNHDLKYHQDIGSIRPWFYEGLKPEDQPRVWRYIEEHYLLRYDDFMAVRFDWSSSGLWRIPFPGSYRDVHNVDLEGLGVPERARMLLGEWHDPLGARPVGEEVSNQAASDTRGLAAAKEVKLFLGERIYLEFRLFREIVITREGTAEEAEVPEFILKSAEGG